MDLQAAEVELLLKACRRYRGKIPAYLQSVQPELAVLDGIIEKLTAARESEETGGPDG